MEYIQSILKILLQGILFAVCGHFLYDNNRINLYNIRIIMADKKQKNQN